MYQFALGVANTYALMSTMIVPCVAGYITFSDN